MRIGFEKSIFEIFRQSRIFPKKTRAKNQVSNQDPSFQGPRARTPGAPGRRQRRRGRRRRGRGGRPGRSPQQQVSTR